MDLAIIIPSFNGAGKLPILLSSISSQWNENIEVIIIDDGSSLPITLPEALFNKIKIKICRIENSGRAIARNYGAGMTKANVILFCDDDMELGEDCLSKHLKFHSQHVNAILTCNPVPPDGFKTSDVFLKYRWRTEKGWSVPLTKRGLYKCSFDDFYITTQNMSLPRKLFFELGGFDTRLKDSEDFDFGARAIQREIDLYVDGSLQVIHHDKADLSRVLRRQREYYDWKLKLLEIHPEYRQEFAAHFRWLDSNKLDRLKRFCFQDKTWWRKLFESWLFKILPSEFQSRLFSNYIYSNTVLKIKPNQK